MKREEEEDEGERNIENTMGRKKEKDMWEGKGEEDGNEGRKGKDVLVIMFTNLT